MESTCLLLVGLEEGREGRVGEGNIQRSSVVCSSRVRLAVRGSGADRDVPREQEQGLAPNAAELIDN